MTDGARQQPEAVPASGAKPAGDIRARWAWVEAEVWTERMLTALEQGVMGGKWHSLIDKVYALPNLRQAFARVKANHGAAGVDHVTVEEFERDLEANLEKLSQALADRVIDRKRCGGIGSTSWAARNNARWGFRRCATGWCRRRSERCWSRFSSGTSRRRATGSDRSGAARMRCAASIRCCKQGYSWVVDADLKSYFDTIPRPELMERVKAKVADGRVLKLLEAFLTQGVLEEMNLWTPEAGTPQGAVISPLLSNIYLDALDHEMAGKGIEMVRYADDFVVLCGTQGEAQQALEEVRRWTAQAGLTLHPVKTRIVDATQPGGFDFLGYHFEQGCKWPRRKSERKFRDTIRAKTRRTHGQSLPATIVDLNRTLVGWFGYFQHSHKTTFATLDGWVRMRLRSILRRRRGGQGRGRGADHQRWPNAYFAERGLFSLVTAHATAGQSSRR